MAAQWAGRSTGRPKIERTEVQEAAAALGLDAADSARLLGAAFPPPPVREWARFVERLCLSVGAGLFVSGVIFFFAYNWPLLHRFAKLATMGGLLLLAGGLSGGLSPRSTASGIAQSVTLVLVGVLLLLFGQIYQTGADAYELFAAWALWTLALAAVSRAAGVWLLWLGVANTGLILYGGQVLGRSLHPATIIATGLLNATVLVAFELHESGARNRSRWFRLAVAILGLGLLVSAASLAILTDFEKPGDAPVTLAAILCVAGLVLCYYHLRRDLGALAVGALAAVGLAFSALIRLLDFGGSAGQFLLGGLVLLGLSTACVLTLLRIRRAWENERPNVGGGD